MLRNLEREKVHSPLLKNLNAADKKKSLLTSGSRRDKMNSPTYLALQISGTPQPMQELTRAFGSLNSITMCNKILG
jgi:hypothetical protein